MKRIKRAFGRLIEFDEKSRKFPVTAVIRRGLKPRTKNWRCDIVLDQGNVGACTGFSVAHEAAAVPVVVPGITNEVAMQVYKRAQQLDQWPGEDYEGSSVLAAMKAGIERRWYKSYRWAFGESDLALAISYIGPAVLGIPWCAGMMELDENGLITVTGELVGEHAILCNGYNATKKLYKLHNSWGAGWGINGECYVRAADMKKLLKENGEACIPLVRGK